MNGTSVQRASEFSGETPEILRENLKFRTENLKFLRTNSGKTHGIFPAAGRRSIPADILFLF
jgi:hypothetical protein